MDSPPRATSIKRAPTSPPSKSSGQRDPKVPRMGSLMTPQTTFPSDDPYNIDHGSTSAGAVARSDDPDAGTINVDDINEAALESTAMGTHATEADKMILADYRAVQHFKSGNLATALASIAFSEQLAENPHGSMFEGLGWDIGKCRGLIPKNPKLTQAVRDCFEQDTLNPLRHYLSVLKSTRKPQSQRDIYLEGGLDTTVTRLAWGTEYKGDAADIFIQAIHGMNTDRVREPYDNFVPIIQSSGMGKSRMVDEAAKFIFTLPFNLRPDADQSGFPAGNTQVLDFLLSGVEKRSTEAIRLRYLKFLEVLFSLVNQEIKSLPICASYEALARSWYDYLDVYKRGHLYTTAIGDLLATCPMENDQKHNLLGAEQAVRTSLKKLSDTIAEHSSSRDSRAWSNYRSAKGKQMQPVRLMLYFDESHELLEKRTINVDVPNVVKDTENQQRSAYQILCRTFSTCTVADLFVVYLSTNSSLSLFSPSHENMWSYRAPMGKLNPDRMQAPIVELPFDTFAKVKEGDIALDSISEPDHMVQFGRPLFWTRWQTAARTQAIEVQRGLFSFAKTKIIGLQDPAGLSSKAAETDSDGQLAALSIRLMLEFEPLRQSADKEAKLVEGHMRVAYSVPRHRQYLRGGTPSEPVLAEAAARIMNDISGGPLSAVSRYLKNGLISKGERGELVARFLLTLAHDRCVQFDYVNAHEAQYSKAIHLFNFLGALVGPDHMNKILDSQPDNVPDGATFREAFRDAKVNFTHFVKGGDKSVISDEAAWLALSRCMAFQCANGQWMIVLYIPVLLWDEKLGRFVVSGIFIQIKNRLKKQPVKIDATKLNFFSRPPAGDPNATRYNERPYITIVMHLGVQPGSSRPKVQKQQQSVVPQTPSKPKVRPELDQPTPSKITIDPGPTKVQPKRNAKKTSKSTHPRYALTIVGCSNTVYDVIGPNDKDKYAALLTSRDVLDEHPRQDDVFIKAVLRLKPYWTKLAQSFHWAADEEEEPQARADDPFKEGLYIGTGEEADSDDEEENSDEGMDVDD